MKKLNNYILEKLKIDKNIKINHNIYDQIKSLVSYFFSYKNHNIQYSIEIKNGNEIKNIYTIEINLKGNGDEKWFNNKILIDLMCRNLSTFLQDNINNSQWLSRSTVEKDNRISITISIENE